MIREAITNLKYFVIKWIGYGYLRLLRATCKSQHEWAGSQPQRVLCALWHGNSVAGIINQAYHYAVLTSPSRDGRIAGFWMHRLGKTVVWRFKPTHTSFERLLQDASHTHIAFTVDGGRGPVYQCKRGVVLAASRTGLPIIPLNIDISPKISLRHVWDHSQIPLPFSRIRYRYGLPIYVPVQTTPQQREYYCRQVEHALEPLLPLAQNAQHHQA